MNWVETLQRLVPLLSGLPLIPTLVISVIGVLITLLFLLLIWTTPPRVTRPSKNPSVIEAYKRMERVFISLEILEDGTITMNGAPVPEDLTNYYVNYAAIAKCMHDNPGDIDGRYEKVWEHGGEGRVYTGNTQPLEAVVSSFFRAYTDAKEAQ